MEECGVWVRHLRKMIREAAQVRAPWAEATMSEGGACEHPQGVLRKMPWPGSLFNALQGPGGWGDRRAMSGRSCGEARKVGWGCGQEQHQVGSPGPWWGLGISFQAWEGTTWGSCAKCDRIWLVFPKAALWGGKSEVCRKKPCSLDTRLKEIFNSLIEMELLYKNWMYLMCTICWVWTYVYTHVYITTVQVYQLNFFWEINQKNHLSVHLPLQNLHSMIPSLSGLIRWLLRSPGHMCQVRKGASP